MEWIRHTPWDGVGNDSTVTTTGTTGMGAATQRPSRFPDLRQDAVDVRAFGGAVAADARAATAALLVDCESDKRR